jgi:hypothetical protein
LPSPAGSAYTKIQTRAAQRGVVSEEVRCSAVEEDSTVQFRFTKGLSSVRDNDRGGWCGRTCRVTCQVVEEGTVERI